MSIESPLRSLNSLSSATDTFKRAAWNILKGSVVIAAGLWVLFHLPHLVQSPLAANVVTPGNPIFPLQEATRVSMLQTLAA